MQGFLTAAPLASKRHPAGKSQGDPTNASAASRHGPHSPGLCRDGPLGGWPVFARRPAAYAVGLSNAVKIVRSCLQEVLEKLPQRMLHACSETEAAALGCIRPGHVYPNRSALHGPLETRCQGSSLPSSTECGIMRPQALARAVVCAGRLDNHPSARGHERGGRPRGRKGQQRSR